MKIKFILFVLISVLGPASSWAKEGEDPASFRVFYTPNALPNSEKKFSITTFDLGLWNLDYAASKNLNLGLQFAPPFGFFGGGPFVRFSQSVSEKFHWGIYATAGGLTFLGFSGNTALYYGAGPIITYGSTKASLTISVLTYRGHYFEEHHNFESEDHKGSALIPTLGGSIQVSNRVKLNMEVLSLNDLGDTEFGKAWVINYGIRVFSEGGSVFGDIGFLAPIFDGAGDLYRVMPFGIPLLSFGFQF